MQGFKLISAGALVAILSTTVAVQTASAGERHARRGDQTSPRMTAPMSPQVRNSNAYIRDYDGPAYSDYSRYQNGAASPPAGR